MDIDEKKAYHQKYNKAYYLKRKFAKHAEGNVFFRKTATPSLVVKREKISKALEENEAKANNFREMLKQSSHI
jgi:hypothetical protein